MSSDIVMKLKLNVPYAEKEIAKALGAQQDGETLYLPLHDGGHDIVTGSRTCIDIEPYRPWLDLGKYEPIVIAKPPLYAAFAVDSCWKCKKESPVICFCAEDWISWYLNNGGDDCEDEEPEIDDFGPMGIFYYVEHMGNELKTIVKENFPFFHEGYSKTIRRRCWFNHCVHCGALKGDYFLHEEMDSVFSPHTEEEAAEVTLVELPLRYAAEMVANVGGSRWSSYYEEGTYDSELIRDCSPVVSLDEFAKMKGRP